MNPNWWEREDCQRIFSTLVEVLDSGDHVTIEIEVLRGYIKRFEVHTLDRATRRVENLSVGEEPSTP